MSNQREEVWTLERWEFGNDETKWRVEPENFYKQQELEIVKWENKYSLKTRVNVDEGESKASRE